MSREPFSRQLQNDWRDLINAVTAPTDLRLRVRPETLYIELEDMLMDWRELWTSNWFAAEQDQMITAEWTLKDVVAHVASWTVELRAQAEVLAQGIGVDYRIVFEETGGPRSWNAEKVEQRRPQSLEDLINEIEKETARFQDLLFAIDIAVLLTERPIGIVSAAAPGDHWIRSIAGLVGMRCFHDRHHIDRILQWKREKLTGEF